MSDYRPGGKRRTDRLLDAAFLADLPALPMQELRERRSQAEQAEADLSYLRRLLQGRLDIVQAEASRRTGEDGRTVLEHLPEVLAHDERTGPFGLGRHAPMEPSTVLDPRRRLDLLAADVGFSDLGSRSDDELQRALAEFTAAEREVSGTRHRLHAVMDTLGAELARRYRDGEASVDSLLTDDLHPGDGS